MMVVNSYSLYKRILAEIKFCAKSLFANFNERLKYPNSERCDWRCAGTLLVAHLRDGREEQHGNSCLGSGSFLSIQTNYSQTKQLEF
jgi:hypothetical protein